MPDEGPLPQLQERLSAVGLFFGDNTDSRSYSCSAELGEALRRKGAWRSTGGARLLRIMTEGGGDPLCPEEAEQAARSVREAAHRLRGDDRRIAEQIAADAQAASDSGRPWTIC